MALSKQEVNVQISKFGKDNKDTGSSSVQIAILTKRIEKLNLHLKTNKQDAEARRSLLILVGKRRSLLDYIARTDRPEYLRLLEQLGLRR